MNRTIIDILQKGNLELFHSSIIAWLLDPGGEHGMKRSFLNGISSALYDRGWTGFKKVLELMPKEVEIKTEAKRYRSRYDIMISVPNSSAPLIIVENKTKSVGDKLQLEGYQQGYPDASVIALGLCKESFLPDVESKCPLITYRDILEILGNVQIPDDKWGVLIREYMGFLHREISLLELTDQCYEQGDISKHSDIVEMLFGAPENDIRFLNLLLLEKLRRRLVGVPKFDGFDWRNYKNDRSGVWLASYWGGQPENYRFTDAIEALLRKYSANLWFHIELTDGVRAKDLSDVAGTFQLKGKTPPTENNRKFADDFLQTRPLGFGEDKPKRIKSSAGSFFVVKKKIFKKDLFLDKLEANFTEFCESFGTFRP